MAEKCRYYIDNLKETFTLFVATCICKADKLTTIWLVLSKINLSFQNSTVAKYVVKIA